MSLIPRLIVSLCLLFTVSHHSLAQAEHNIDFDLTVILNVDEDDSINFFAKAHSSKRYSNPLSSTFTSTDQAAAYHQQALDYARKEQYDIALAYFRLAVRHNNESAFYWSDLGVTEMRVQQFQKAKRRFMKALSIDPSLQLARDNIKELNRYALSEEDRVALHDSRKESLMLEYKGDNYRVHSITKTKELSRSDFMKILYPKRYEHLLIQWLHLNQGKSEEAFNALVDCGSILIIPQNHQIDIVLQEDNKFTLEQKELFSAPFVVRNLLPQENRQWNQRFTTKSLIERYGNQRVDFYPHNMIEEQVHPVFNSLQDSIYQLHTQPTGVYTTIDLSEQGSYIQWNLDALLYNDLINSSDSFTSSLNTYLPRFFDLQEDDNLFSSCMSIEDSKKVTIKNGKQYIDYGLLSEFYLKTHWKMFVIGNEQAGMFFHQDILQASAWQLQLQGKKKWHICPGRKDRSQNSATFTPPTNAAPTSSNDSYHYFYYKAGDIDMFSPDYAKYPEIKKAVCHETTLFPGDLIYYPGDYWHQTLNLQTLTVALSSSMMLSPFDFYIVRKEMRRECGGTNRIFPRDEEFCKKLQRCFQLWYQASGVGDVKKKQSIKSEL